MLKLTPLEKKAVGYIGSKAFTITILKIGAGYLFYLTALLFFGLRPAFYMIWLPFAVWGVFFLVNLAISISTHKYVHTGNLIFHISFIIIICGILISALMRFEGETLIMEGDSFFGDKNQYLSRNCGDCGSFKKNAPDISFKVSNITPRYWKNELYFTGLKADIGYPAETLEKRGEVWLNNGPVINGARLRLTGFGFFPELLLEENGRIAAKGTVFLTVFPPGAEDSIDFKNYKIYINVYPDPAEEGGRIVNASMNAKEPLFLVRITWFDREVGRGAVKRGETVKFGGLALTFTGIRYYVKMGVVKDPGETVVFIGFITALFGLALRIIPELRGRDGEGREGGGAAF